MDIRVLKYFLAVANEQSFTRAAETLHITQPTLSRQLAQLEEEVGSTLFVRGGRSLTLTETGMLLKRRAMEIVELENQMMDELKAQNQNLEGCVTIGCGETTAVELLAEICSRFRKKYPRVQIAIHTATADMVRERMERGLTDIGLLLEPASTEGMDYIRIPDTDHWVVGMRPDDPLAEKEFITKEDLLGKPLIMPERLNVRSNLANWFGEDYGKINTAFISNMGTNAGVMARKGLGYPLSVGGAVSYWNQELLVQRPLYPAITGGTYIAWRRGIPYSVATRKFIEEVRAWKMEEELLNNS